MTARTARAPHGVRPAYEGPTITITQIHSGIGAKPKTRGTLKALGLNGIGQSNVLPDRPEIRGMIARVPHLVSVTSTDGAAT
jgi:large subunit ribosomal protein L30